ncbi:MAG TPA: hypothetical protein ENJ86_07760 [Methylothermaceae bacterium]|nr:hypothetical protein [Methylothermaceae bacterium]
MKIVGYAASVLLLGGIGSMSSAAEDEAFQRIVPVAFENIAKFGQSLDVKNGLAVIGGHDRAVVFQRDFPLPDQWGQVVAFSPKDSAQAKGFGAAVTWVDQALAVAAPKEDTGRVYRYGKDPAGNWRLLEVIQPPESQASQRFGTALASHEGWLAVGAPFAEVKEEKNAGRVYLYHCPAGQPCGLAAQISDPTPEADARFGLSLAMTGQWLAVGSVAKDVVQFKGALIPKSGVDTQNFAIAKGDAPFCGEDVGAVFIYSLAALREGSTVPADSLAPPDAECLQQFGAALALEGDLLAVGSPTKDVGDKLFSGVVYVYRALGRDGGRRCYWHRTKPPRMAPLAAVWCGGTANC